MTNPTIAFNYCILILDFDRFHQELNVRLSLPAVSMLVVLYHFLAGVVPRHNGVVVFYASTFALNAFMVAGSIVAITKFCHTRRMN